MKSGFIRSTASAVVADPPGLAQARQPNAVGMRQGFGCIFAKYVSPTCSIYQNKAHDHAGLRPL